MATAGQHAPQGFLEFDADLGGRRAQAAAYGDDDLLEVRGVPTRRPTGTLQVWCTRLISKGMTPPPSIAVRFPCGSDIFLRLMIRATSMPVAALWRTARRVLAIGPRCRNPARGARVGGFSVP